MGKAGLDERDATSPSCPLPGEPGHPPDKGRQGGKKHGKIAGDEEGCVRHVLFNGSADAPDHMSTEKGTLRRRPGPLRR